MALTLIINLSKKIPGPVDYSSIQASCSIEGEIAAGQDPVAESARLFSQAEEAVDRQLGLTAVTPISASSAPAPAPVPPRSSSAPAGAAPYPSSGARRAPTPISAAQLRFLRQLLDRTPGAQDRVLAEHQVQRIEALTSRAASAVIDRLKAPAP